MTRRLVTRQMSKRLSRMMEQAAFNDTAHYYAEASLATLDNYGQPTPATTYTVVSCSFSDGFDRQRSHEQWTELADIAQIATEIRVKEIIPNRGGRFVHVKKFNQVLAVQNTYEVVGIRDRGEFGYVCAAKKVTL